LLVTNHPARGKNGKYFIDHNPKYFDLVLHFLRDGRFLDSDIKTVDLDELGKEFDFFKIPRPSLLAPKQVVKLSAHKHAVRLERSGDGETLLTHDLKKEIKAWLPKKNFSLLYKATWDGFDAKDFHQRCYNAGSTITLVQSQEGYLFGGYTSLPWEGNGVYKTDPTAFLFTLINPHALPPTQYPINLDQTQHATHCHPLQCATFGRGPDLAIHLSPHPNRDSYTYFPNTYCDTTGMGGATFTDSVYFMTTDVEVYLVTSKPYH